MIGDIIGFAVTVFMGIFTIINPVANMPVFLGLTQGANEDLTC